MLVEYIKHKLNLCKKLPFQGAGLVFLFGLWTIFSIVRIYKLDFESLWLDEIVSVVISKKGIYQAWLERAADYNPPLYDIMMYPIIKLFGISEIIVRLPSVIAGTISIALIALYFLQFGLTPAIFATLFIGFSYPHFYYSREARPYAFVFLFSAMVLLYVMRKLNEEKINWTQIEILVLATLLSLNNYFHYTGVIFTAAFMIILFILGKQLKFSLKNFLNLTFFLIIFYLPWLLILWRHSQQKPEHLGNHADDLMTLLNDLGQFSMGNLYFFYSMIFFTFVIFVIFGAKQKFARTGALFLILNSLVPFAITLYILQVHSPGHLFSHHVYEMLPGLFLSFLFSYIIVYQKKKWVANMIMLIIIGVQIHIFWGNNPWNIKRKDDERGVAQYISKQDIPCKMVVTTGTTLAYEYYSSLLDNRHKSISVNQTNADYLISKIRGKKCKYLFFLEYPNTDKVASIFNSQITKSHTKVNRVEFNRINVEFWLKTNRNL